jgi:hypothetical protein
VYRGGLDIFHAIWNVSLPHRGGNALLGTEKNIYSVMKTCEKLVNFAVEIPLDLASGCLDSLRFDDSGDDDFCLVRLVLLPISNRAQVPSF